jgi:hypothetical protein
MGVAHGVCDFCVNIWNVPVGCWDCDELSGC